MRKRNNHSIIFISLIAIILVGILVVFVWWQNGLQPVQSQDTTYKAFTIQKGMSLRQIASNLKAQGLVRDSTLFLITVKMIGIDNMIQAGTFELSPSMDIKTIAKKLTKSTNDILVTIPEGKRADEIADILKEKIPTYTDIWKFDLEKNEGYLFPDTYYFAKDSTINQIITTMKDNFEGKYAALSPSVLPRHDIITLASLIEREARHAEDRSLVSSVLHNRLNIGMALQVDATIQYALGYDTTEHSWWKKNLTVQELQISSPYNTYQNSGLPPGPICNPGIASIQAAINPANNNYIYYISDKQGVNHYASTLDGHNENIRKYGL